MHKLSQSQFLNMLLQSQPFWQGKRTIKVHVMVRQIRRHRIRNNKLNKFALLTQNHLMICLSNASYLYNNACILLGLPLTELAFVNKTPTYVCWAILQFFLRNALYWIFSWVIFNDWYNWKFLKFSSFVMFFFGKYSTEL